MESKKELARGRRKERERFVEDDDGWRGEGVENSETSGEVGQEGERGGGRARDGD